MRTSTPLRLPRFFLAVVLLADFGPALLAADLPDGPLPSVYTEKLAPQLTPIESILTTPIASTAAGDSGVCVLDERIVTADMEGRKIAVLHFAYKTLTDAGVSSNSDDTFPYRKHQQKIYLVLAETIQADGTHQEVQPNAVLIQSPQRQAEYSLYDDQAEMKIIFPNVKPGSITHGIVVIEDTVARFPGEFNHNFNWQRQWSIEHLRLRVDLPAVLAARLKNETLGTALPVLTVHEDNGYTQYAWSLDALRGERYEVESAPSGQIGPAIHLSTIASWDEIGRWYRKLLQGRDQLSPELEKQVDTWAPAGASRGATIAALHAQVADEVRYVGLELGTADYQPHNCNEVWANRYGDCKDKANLLVALLHRRGIDASIALVNTSHLGLIDRRTPDYRAFSHAIVAIPDGKGTWLFCDPTIAYSTPGMLSPGSADRDVLVIAGQGSEWVRTPPVPAGSLQYDFDLKLEENGDLAGWMTTTADGYYGAAERGTFIKMQPADLRSEMSRRVRSFYPSAEIVDATLPESARDRPLQVKAYFTVTGAAREQESRQTVLFPQSSGLFPNVGDRPERQTTYFLYRDSIRVSARIALPRDFAADQVVPDFHAESSAGTFRASWNVSARQCEARLELTMKSSAVRREEFGRFYQSIQAVRTWLAQPLILHAAGTSDSAAAMTELDFPLMPTGDGQINLVDQRYPESGDPELRRRALEKTVQFFPKEKPIVFRAGTRLAVLDWNASRYEAAHNRLAALLKTYAGQVPPDIYAWAETVDGHVLRDMKKHAEALVLLERVSRNSNLTADRRARAAPVAAELLAAKSPHKAIELLITIATLPGGSTTEVEAKLAELLLAKGRGKELAAHLRKLVEGRPDTCEQELTAILEAAQTWPQNAAGAQGQLAALVSVLQPSPGAALAKAMLALDARARLIEVRAKVGAVLAGPLFASWKKADAPRRSLEDFTKVIAEADKANNAAESLRLSLQSLTQYEADDQFPERIWRAASNADWVQRQGTTPIDPAIADALLDLCDQLPATHSYYLEGRLLRGTRLANAGNRAGEIALLKAALDQGNLPENYFVAFHRRAAAALERDHAYTAALAHYAAIETIALDYRTGGDLLIRAVFIHLHLGQDADALRLIAQLKKLPESTLGQSTYQEQIKELIQVADSGQAEAVWAAGRSWWPQWQAYVHPYLNETDAIGTVIPVIDDLHAMGVTFGQAKRDNDTKGYFILLNTFISAARWLPSYPPEVSGLYAFTMTVSPEHATELRTLVLASLRGPHPASVANAAARQLQLSIQLFDAGQPREAQAVARNYLRTNPPENEFTHSVRRMLALAASTTHEDVAAAAAELAHDLDDPKLAPQRLFSVRQLATLYRSLGRSTDEEQLLQRELGNPIISADESAKELRARLTQLVGERDFTAEIARWRAKLDPAWYGLAEPQSLDDPRLRNLEEVLNAPDKNFTLAEQVKLLLLAAEDLRRSLPQRQVALRGAVSRLMQLTPTYSRLNTVVASIVDNTEFDEETRVSTLWLSLIMFYSEERSQDYERWRRHAFSERFNANVQKNLLVLDRLARVDHSSPEAILELARQMSAEEVTNFAGFGLHDLFTNLLNLGDFAAADKFIALIPTWRLGADVQDTVQARQLDYTRRLRLARSTERVHAVFIAAVRERFPHLDKASEMPAEYADLRMRNDVPRTGPTSTRQACLYLIKMGRFNRSNLDFWGTLLRTMSNQPGEVELIDAVTSPAFQAAETDQLRNAVLQMFAGNVDTDKPPVLAAINRAAGQTITAAQSPASYLTYRLFQAKVADRTGALKDVETTLADMTDPSAEYFQKSLNLRVYARRGDLPGLKRAVDSLPTAALLSPALLDESLQAFARLNLPDELAVARDTARTLVRKSVVQSWADYDSFTGVRAASYAEDLADPALLPLAWVEEMGTNLPDPFARQIIRVIDACLRKDWSAAEKIGTALVQQYPSHYHYYWYVGLAASELGHRAPAIAALKTYVQYSKEEREYPEALALLQRLEGKPANK